jgi:hypothetical protein
MAGIKLTTQMILLDVWLLQLANLIWKFQGSMFYFQVALLYVSPKQLKLAKTNSGS